MLKHSSGFYIGSMRQQKLSLVSSRKEDEKGDSRLEPQVLEVPLEAIQALHLKYKAVKSAYFLFATRSSWASQQNQVSANLALLEHELKQRSLRFRCLPGKEGVNKQSGLVSLMIFSIDQQAARRLAQRFQPEKALWFNRMGASKLLLAQSNDVDSVCE